MFESRTANISLLFLVVIIWGLSFVFIKVSLSQIPPATLALLRFMLASLVLVVICVATRNRIRPLNLADLMRISVLGLSGITILFLLEFWSLDYITAGLCSVLASTTAMFIAIFSVLFLKERVRIIQVAGLGLGFLGVLVLVSNGELLSGWNGPLIFGSMLMLMSSVSWAAYTIWVKEIMGRYPPIVITTNSFIMGTLFLVPFSLAEFPWNLSSLSWEGWAMVLYIALPASALAYIIYNRVVKVLPAMDVGALLYFIPLWGVLFDTFLLQTQLTWVMLLGSALVIGGVVLVER